MLSAALLASSAPQSGQLAASQYKFSMHASLIPLRNPGGPYARFVCFTGGGRPHCHIHRPLQPQQRPCHATHQPSLPFAFVSTNQYTKVGIGQDAHLFIPELCSTANPPHAAVTFACVGKVTMASKHRLAQLPPPLLRANTPSAFVNQSSSSPPCLLLKEACRSRSSAARLSDTSQPRKTLLVCFSTPAPTQRNHPFEEAPPGHDARKRGTPPLSQETAGGGGPVRRPPQQRCSTTARRASRDSVDAMEARVDALVSGIQHHDAVYRTWPSRQPSYAKGLCS